MATRASEEPRIQTPDLRILLSHFLRQIEARHVRTKEHPAVPLHYDSKTGNLVEYFWPCEINPDSKKEEDKYRRVRPCDLESYRRTHHFRGPCCLCAFLDDKDYTEAQIAIVEVLTADEGRNHCVLNGEIVAQCAVQRCGYLVCIERFYQLNDIPLRKYPRRVTPLPPVHLIHISDVEKSFRRGEGLFQVMPDVVSRGHHAGFKRVNPEQTKAVQASLWVDLMQGMPEGRFWDTFVQCTECNQVTFREHYAVNHGCAMVDPKEGPNARYHPYRRSAIPGDSSIDGTRLLARMDTLPADEPDRLPLRSLSAHRRTATQDSVALDPEDFASIAPEGSEFANGTWEEFNTALQGGSDDDSYEEVADDGESLENGDSGLGEPAVRASEEGSAWPWWLPDIPPMPSSDDPPDLVAILEATRRNSQDSNVRIGVEDAE